MITRFVVLIGLLAALVVTASAQQADMYWVQRGESQTLWQLQVSGDGTTYLSAGDNGIKRWETNTGKLLRYIPAINPGKWRLAQYSPDGRFIVVPVSENSISNLVVYDASTGQVIAQKESSDETIVISPDSRYLVSFERNHFPIEYGATIWNLPSLQKLGEIQDSIIINAQFSYDSKYLFLNYFDSVVAYNVETRGKADILPGGTAVGVDLLGLVKHGTALVGIDNKYENVVLWDFTNHTKRLIAIDSSNWIYHRRKDVTNISCSINGSYVAFVHTSYDSIIEDADSVIQFLDVDSGEFIAHVSMPPSEYIRLISFLPDGSGVLVNTNYRVIRRYDLQTATMVDSIPDAHSYLAHASAYSPDGKYVASSDVYAHLWTWDAQTGKRLWGYGGINGQLIHAIAYAPDASAIAFTVVAKNSSYKEKILLCDPATGTEILSIPTSTGAEHVMPLTFTLDGRYILAGVNEHVMFGAPIKMWDAATGDSIKVFRGHTSFVYEIAMSPDGRTMASASADSTVRLWDIATGATIKTFTGHQGSVNSVAFTPDGRFLVSASSDTTVREWDIATGSVREFRGHKRVVNAVRPSPDGKWLYSAASDGMVLVWDRLSGEIIYTYVDSAMGLKQWFTSLSVVPAGYGVATTGLDGSVMMLKPVETLIPSSVPVAENDDATSIVIHPNPISNMGEVQCTLAKAGQCRITVINQIGEDVAIIADKWLEAGRQGILWSAEGLPAGVYLLRVMGEGINSAQRVVVMR